MTRIKITPDMLAAGGRIMEDSGVDAAITMAYVHGVELKPSKKGYSPLERAYRAMRKLEPITT